MNKFQQAILRSMLRPPGGGIYTLSTGQGAAIELQKKHYYVSVDKSLPDVDSIESEWIKDLNKIKSAKVILLGIPLDTGAGIRRGAAYGPRAVRGEMLKNADYQSWVQSGKVIDIGDILVNPHLLHDEMLNKKFIKDAQTEMYPSLPQKVRVKLPVSALSQTEYVLGLIYKLNPKVKVFIIGGDHSVAWPVTTQVYKVHKKKLGIVQPDAHTDLLSSRLGVKYCFGTWSFHASKLLGNKGKLVQVGIRQTGRDQEHWEKTTGVKQFWAKDVNKSQSSKVISEMVAHLKKVGVQKLYFSNDIDGTDESEASATGTPASHGLRSEFLIELIQALCANFEMVAADIVEVAPDLARNVDEREKTVQLAARYSMECLRGMVGG